MNLFSYDAGTILCGAICLGVFAAWVSRRIREKKRLCDWRDRDRGPGTDWRAGK